MNLNLGAITSFAAATETAPQSKSSKRLEGAAKEFEALMISQMMKTARESSGGWLNDGDETGEDSMMGMAEDQFAQAMAKSGGLGLAKMVVKTMSRPEAAAAPSANLPNEIEKK